MGKLKLASLAHLQVSVLAVQSENQSQCYKRLHSTVHLIQLKLICNGVHKTVSLRVLIIMLWQLARLCIIPVSALVSTVQTLADGMNWRL